MIIKAFVASIMLFAMSTSFALTPQEQANKDVVLKFYAAAINDKDADAAVKFLGSKYIQHNPRFADGAEPLRGFIGFLKNTSPLLKGEIKRVIVEGDLVVLHVHSKATPEALGNAIVDIFRVENGLIVEHWDVIQAVPEKSANSNTMF